MTKTGLALRQYNTAYGRTRRARLRAAGLCPGCGGTPTPGYISCQNCLRRLRKYQSSHRKAGLCLNCPRRAKKGRVLCDRHLTQNRERGRQRRAKGSA